MNTHHRVARGSEKTRREKIRNGSEIAKVIAAEGEFQARAAELGEVLLVVVQLNCHGGAPMGPAGPGNGRRQGGATRAMLGATAHNW